MSRIILSRYDDGADRFVVGWDHPCGGAFWQEFNEEPEGGDYENWTEVKREGGFFHGIPLDRFQDSVPDDLRPLLTPEVMEMLYDHSVDPDSGLKRPIDLTRR